MTNKRKKIVPCIKTSWRPIDPDVSTETQKVKFLVFFIDRDQRANERDAFYLTFVILLRKAIFFYRTKNILELNTVTCVIFSDGPDQHW